MHASHVPGETIKPNTSDSSSCTEDCGGGSKVANAEHIACGELWCWFIGATFLAPQLSESLEMFMFLRESVLFNLSGTPRKLPESYQLRLFATSIFGVFGYENIKIALRNCQHIF